MSTNTPETLDSMNQHPTLHWALSKGYTYVTDLKSGWVIVAHSKFQFTSVFGENGTQHEFWNYFNRMEDWI